MNHKIWCVVTALVFTGVGSAQIYAQEYWNGRSSGSPYAESDYSNRYEAIELIPYGPNSEYFSPSNQFASRPPFAFGGCGFNEQYRNPYQDPVGREASGCSCPGREVDPYARNRFDERVTEEFYRNRQLPYETEGRYGDSCCGGGNDLRGGQHYRAPAPHRMERYLSTPADQPPRLRSPQTFGALPNIRGNDGTSFNRFQPAPELSRQWAPAPNSNEAVKEQQMEPRREDFPPAQQSLPQMQLPSGSTNSQSDSHDHSGHDHSGHQH